MQREYYSINNDETMIIVKDAKIVSIKKKNITKKSIRLFDNDKKIMALAAAVGNIPDSDLEKQANSLLSLGIPFDYELEKEIKGKFEKNILSIKNIQELEYLTERILKDLKHISTNFVINGDVIMHKMTKSIRNSLLLDLSSVKTLLSFSFCLKQKGSGNILDTFVGSEGFDFNESNYQNFLKDADFLSKACLSNEIKLENKKYKILTDNNLLLRKFNSDVTAIPYEEKTSLLTGKLNEQVFDSNIHINECYDYEGLNSFVPFDDEGIIRTNELVLVQNGILKTIFYDKKQGKKYGKTTTGNGFRSYNTNPGISIRKMRFLGIEEKASNLLNDDLIILPLFTSGGDFLPNGNFSLPVQMGFVFKNGKFVGKTPQITLTGNYLDCLNKEFICLAKNDILSESLDETLVLSNIQVNVN